MRQPAARVKPRIAEPATFPAPVGGWIKNTNLASPDARRADGSKVNGAYLLENWFPIATGIRMRGGSDNYAQLGNGSLDVTSIFSYVNGNNRKLFATTEEALYEITSPALGLNSLLVDDLGNYLVDDLGNYLIGVSSVGDPDVDSLTGGDWIVVQFATPGGVFLRAVNGSDTPLVYDGSDWDTTPAITGPDPTTLSYVWAYKNRLFFIEKDSLNAHYLEADNIGGAATELPLGGVFTRGGSLMFGASWSIEGGGGLTAQCIFVTTEGEVAVYQGGDPSTADDWALVGVYRIGKPLGPKAWIHAGGDLVIATDVGFIPLSQAVQRDYAALAPAAISYPIETAWNDAVAADATSWDCEVWPAKQMVIVAPPTAEGQTGQLFAANARTGAWAPFTGWNIKCLGLFGDRMFFGSTEGKIIECEVTGADQGVPYTAKCIPLYDPLKAPASVKTALMMRATVRAPSRVVPQLSLQADYNVNLPAVPDDAALVSSDVWGVGIWGTAKWGGATTVSTFQEWQSVAGAGYAVAPGVQITSGSPTAPDLELVQVEMTYDMGDIGS